ncbi:MAG: hypothetical protein LBJ48_02010 [Coriobacteriales bacterium]|jgi:hypothetical protein|nr:hypothetical protein [Coriobacteriales bacterium]
MEDLPLTTYENASPEVKKEYDYWIQRSGRITNMKRLMLQDPPTYRVFMAWYDLYERLVGLVSERAANLYCYAISTANHCLLCSTFFRRIFVEAGEDPEAFTLDETEQLLFDLGSAIASDPNGIPAAVSERLELRFSAQELVLIIGFGAQMVATNYFNMISRVAVDDVLEPYMTPEFLAQVAAER